MIKFDISEFKKGNRKVVKGYVCGGEGLYEKNALCGMLGVHSRLLLGYYSPSGMRRLVQKFAARSNLTLGHL